MKGKTRVLMVVLTPMSSGKPERVGGIQTRISNYLRLLPELGIRPFILSINNVPGNYGEKEILKLEPTPWSLFRFIRILRQNQINIVHLLEGSLSLFPVLILKLAKTLGCRTAVSFYGGEINEVRKIRTKFLLRASVNITDVIIANSKATKGIIPGTKKPSSLLVYPGADQSMVNTIRKKDGKGGGKVIFVGRMGKRKGAVDLVSAFAKVHEEMPWTRLAIIGTGPTRNVEEVHRRSIELGVEDAVEMVGRLEHDDPELAERYSEADVFSMPAKDVGNRDVEGFGCVFLEAALFETPSVGTFHFGIPEAIENGKTGLLVNPGDVESLAQEIIKLLRNAVLRKRLGKNARSRVYARYLDRHSTESLAASYVTLMER